MLSNMLEEKTKEWGIFALNISTSKRVKCKCYNPATREGTPNCPKCFGTGKMTAVRMIRVIIDAFDEKEYILSPGYGSVDAQRVSIYSEESLNEKDVVLIVGFRGDKVCSIKNVFTVTQSKEFRWIGGKFVYNLSVARERTDLVPKYTSFIRENVGKTFTGKWVKI